MREMRPLCPVRCRDPPVIWRPARLAHFLSASSPSPRRTTIAQRLLVVSRSRCDCVREGFGPHETYAQCFAERTPFGRIRRALDREPQRWQVAGCARYLTVMED